MIASAEQVPDVSKALDIARKRQPPTGPMPRPASERLDRHDVALEGRLVESPGEGCPACDEVSTAGVAP